jgi:tetratricopeptide (TPR) repeat protein
MIVLALAGPVAAQSPWHLVGWQARAVVEIGKLSDTPGADTAAVKVLCQGQVKVDGSDFRVLDNAGKPVPFQLTYHDSERYSLLSFRATGAKPKDQFFVYFGNPGARRAPEEGVGDPNPGAGAPKGAWVPKQGFVLQTIQRPEGDNPRTVDDLKKLIAGSKAKYGARYQRQVSDGFNPFGPSDYYISLYSGWINIPAAGKYKFCTASNEASFSFLDGKELVHWPGRHTAERGIHGEVNTEVELTAGPHYLEYYHEEVTLEQVAFLGWQPPGARNFGATPLTLFPTPHEGTVVRYDGPAGPLVRFEPVVTDSIWPVERHEGQYTRCKFVAPKPPAALAGATYRWDFGDGQNSTGAEVEHVYLTLGTYPVTLTAQTAAGTQTAKWPLLIFEIENVTDKFKEGKPKDYAKLAKRYDQAKLDAEGLKELAFLLAESEDYAGAIEVGKAFVQRFGATAKPLAIAKVRRLMAESALHQGKTSIDEAIANFQASLVKEMPPVEKIDVLARLIRLIGTERNQPEKAGEILAQVEEVLKDAKVDEDVRAAYRRAVIAAADVLLWTGKRDGAGELYAKAERLTGKFIPPQVRAARIGSYPNSLKEYVSAGNFGAALDLVDKWDETFPTDKPNGHTFFWRGKLLLLRGQPQDAERYLARAIRLTIGAGFETEARWLLAEALDQLGQKDEARRELQRLVATGIEDDFTKRAREKLTKP